MASMCELDDQIHPAINIEETIGKTVGRRIPSKPSKIQETGKAIYRARKFQVCPRGVFRFNSHEEANAWTSKMAVQRALTAERS